MERLDQKNYYELLGVTPGASAEEIRSAYHELARIYHPDSHFYDEIVEQAPTLNEGQIKIFKIITAAYNTLINSERRSGYDATLAPKLPDWHSPASESFHMELLKKKPPRGFGGPLVDPDSDEPIAVAPRRVRNSHRRLGLMAWALVSTLTTVTLLLFML